METPEMETPEMTQDQQHIAMLSQNLKYLTNRLVNTEMALDVFLGMLFEENDQLKEDFEKNFKERMESIREQYAAQEKQQAEAMAEAIKNEAKEEDNVDVVVTPNGASA